MIETNEPRALAAALSGPAFTPRGHAMLAAERHVDRWAPETNTDRVRPLRNLGFADRLVTPWMETAQRSVSHLQRLFGPLAGDDGSANGQPDHASWLFPRPSYQDELDWMAAARQPQRDAQQPSPLGLPVSLHDYIAPSLAKTPRAPFMRGLAAFEGVLGPRLVMPVGLGGLVAMVNHNLAVAGAARRGGFAAPSLRVPTLQALIPSMTLVATVAHQFGIPRPKTSAFAAVQEAAPAALQHVAWSDRWLARFAGARDTSLDVAAPKFSAPELILMAPQFDATARPVVKRMVAAPTPTIRRYDDDEVTPDEVFTEVSAATARAHASARGRAPTPAAPMVRRDSVADAIAHAVPAAPDAGVSAQLASSPFAPAFRHILPLAAAPVFDVRSIDTSGLSVAYLAGMLLPATGLVVAGAAVGESGRMVTREGFDWSPTFVAMAPAQRAQESTEPVTARSALLAQESRPVVTGGRRRSVADTMVSAMALPLLAESLDEAPGAVDISGVHQRVAIYAAPGMVAERAHAWSVAQERATSDLAYDFVPPELVLAARVYGLGPAEASQAMRLATAGSGQLVAMAGAVDRTFVQVLEIEADRRNQARGQTSRPAQATSVASADYSSDDTGDAPAAPPTSTAAFGVDRRQPRGAFMWPAAAVAALGMSAAPPEGDALMPVAALELLAAAAVAQLGTYAVLGDGRSQPRPELSLSLSDTAERTAPSSDSTTLPGPRSMPAQQRAAFEALYIAMEKSRDPQSSLAADAARAVAFAGRGDSTFGATDRARAAWSVLPLVALRTGPQGRSVLPRYGDSTAASVATSGGGSAADIVMDRSALGMPVVSGPAPSAAWTGDMDLYAPPAGFVESRPGMAQLSARAGEALSSYVTPVVVSAPADDSESRAAAAAAEIMRPGRSSGRFGGGETEIPTWFEAAARKLLSERGGSDGLSLAELTLVNSAPAQQIAAADDKPATAAPQEAQPAAKPEFTRADVEAIATRVLRIVHDMIEAAKTRGGMYV